MRAVPDTHPLYQSQHFLGVPGPKTHACQRLRGITDPVEDIVVDTEGFGIVGFDAEEREAELANAELEQAMLELEELTGPVCSFAQRHDTRLADGVAELFQVGKAITCFHRHNRDCLSPYPAQDFISRTDRRRCANLRSWCRIDRAANPCQGGTCNDPRCLEEGPTITLH